MAQPPIKPRRRAARLMIVTAIALVAGAIWWSRTPHIDPRLVGSWSVSQPGVTGPPRTWILDSNGTCRHISQQQREEFAAPWRVDGEMVVFGQGPMWASDAMESINRVFQRTLRWSPLLPPIALNIASADEQSFVLRHAGGGQLDFTRIPDVTVQPRPINDQTRVLMAVAIATVVVLVWNARRRRKRQGQETVRPTGNAAAEASDAVI